MNTDQLNAFLKCDFRTREFYLGAFPKDRMPRIPANMDKYCFILNTDNHDKKGQHWVAIYKDKHNLNFFCSYGAKPCDYNICLRKYGKRVIYSKKQIQVETEEMCGAHCIFFLTCRCQGISFFKIINELYNNNLNLNDYISALNLCIHLKQHVKNFCKQ